MMKGTHKVGNTINSNSDMKYHINNVIPVWYANFHLFFNVIPLLRKATYENKLLDLSLRVLKV